MPSGVVAQSVLCSVEPAAGEVRLIPWYTKRCCLPPLHSRHRCWRRILHQWLMNQTCLKYLRTKKNKQENISMFLFAYYLEADVSSWKIIGKNYNRSSFISPQLLTVGPAVAGSVVPFYHRLLPPFSLERYVRLCHRDHHLLSAPPPLTFQKKNGMKFNCIMTLIIK